MEEGCQLSRGEARSRSRSPSRSSATVMHVQHAQARTLVCSGAPAGAGGTSGGGAYRRR